MSSPRIIITKKQPVFMGHVCSLCGCPVVSSVLIEAEAQRSYTFSESKAERIARDTADVAICDEIRRIEKCQVSRSVLVSKVPKSSMIEPGWFCNSHISGFDYPCPNCGNMEPWQIEDTNRNRIQELEDKSFPSIFLEYKESENWAISYNQSIITQIGTIRENADRVALAESEVSKLLAEIENIKKQRDSIPELGQIITMEKEQKWLMEKIKEAGLFNFGEKKAIKERLNVLSICIDELNSVLKRKQNSLDQQIAKRKRMLHQSQRIAYGCTGRSLVYGNNHSAYFLIETNV